MQRALGAGNGSMDDSEEIKVRAEGENFICPSCGDTVGGFEVFTIEPSGISDPTIPLGYMKVRCAGCSLRLDSELAT